MAYIDMTGWKMSEHGVPDSRWKVLEKATIKDGGQICWLCRCSCENTQRKLSPEENFVEAKQNLADAFAQNLIVKIEVLI